MKKYISICVSIILTLACSKAHVGKDLIVRASISMESDTDATKVSYTENTESNPIALDLNWEIGDKVIGYVGNDTFEYTVATVNEGEAKLQWNQGYKLNGTEMNVNMFYAPGIEYASAKSFSINYSQQDINDPLPCLLSATGDFADGFLIMKFHPQSAILSISGIDGLQAGEKVDRIEITGTSETKISVTGGDAGWTANDWGIISDTIRVALPTGSNQTVTVKVFTDGKSNGKQILQFQRTITAGRYYYSSKGNKSVAVQTGGVTTLCQTIEDALTTANKSSEDVTVTLLDDASSNSTLEILNNSNKKITLDLNGKTLSSQINVKTNFVLCDKLGNGRIQYSDNTVKIDSVSAQVEIYGGSIYATNGNYALAAYGSTQNSNLTPSIFIYGGKMIAENGSAISSRYSELVFSCSDDEDIFVTGGDDRAIFSSTQSTIQITGGTYCGKTAAVYFGASSVNLTINSGKFTSNDVFFTYYKSTINPTVTIKDGYFSWSGSVFSNNHSKLKITGGYYCKSITNGIPSGYSCVSNTDPETMTSYPYIVR